MFLSSLVVRPDLENYKTATGQWPTSWRFLNEWSGGGWLPTLRRMISFQMDNMGLGQNTPALIGYDRKGVLRTRTGYRIWPNIIPVLVTGTGIFIYSFWFRSIWNRNVNILFRFRLNRNRKLDFTRFPDVIYRNSFFQKFILFLQG